MSIKTKAQKHSTLVSLAAGGATGAALHFGAGVSAPLSVAGAVAVGGVSKWALSTNKKVTTLKAGDVTARIHKGKKSTSALITFPTEMADVNWGDLKDFLESKDGKETVKMIAAMGQQLGEQLNEQMENTEAEEAPAAPKAKAKKAS